ncbi:unnamed protein product [Symbiodinium natans]|uniref:Uncharacterized protein n=1 Tax=Symbiodinium natans TaxID=878477 RepID=A0A812TTT7_9DINO|nr:unnamed protein product [Symbiodinium natans]
MPVSEAPEQRQSRRAAVRTICRLSTALASPEKLGKDVGGQLLAERVVQLRQVLEGEELQLLEDTVQQYESAVGRALNFSDAPEPSASEPSAAALPVREGPEGASPAFRIHGADVQLTFNKTSWRAPFEQCTETWFSSGGTLLVAQFQEWAMEILPPKFREPNKHISLTLEESCRAAEGTSRVHLHAQITFERRIDRTSVADFMFDGVRPHVVTHPHSAAVHGELNKARGPHVAVSRNRSHFYVYCTKVGTLWSFTNYWPFVDYEVQPHWLMGWWATGKLTNEQYKGYLRRCKRSYRTLLQNFESVVQAEKAAQLTEYREAVAQVLSLARLPFRCVDDPLFPNLQAFLDQFHWATDRYKIYALQGHSQAAKTSFVKSLFAKPFVVTIQGQDVLNLQAFEYGHHDALILDNLVDWSLILQYRALLQANVDLHRLGESATGIYAYSVFLWAVPICITLDADVNCAPFYASDWLQANVYLDVLPRGAKCYIEGERPRVRMTDVPQLRRSP